MKTKIENSKDLRREIRRLEGVKETKKAEIMENIHDIKESLSPLNLLNSFIESLFNKKNNGNDPARNTMNKGIMTILETLMVNLFYKMEHKLEPTFEKIIDKVKTFFSKKSDS
ncbi:MAG: hypothetical protein WCL14_05775 [Bacteroidota bacterium]